MNESEMRECLNALLGEDGARKMNEAMKDISSRDFAEQILGFEPLLKE